MHRIALEGYTRYKITVINSGKGQEANPPQEVYSLLYILLYC